MSIYCLSTECILSIRSKDIVIRVDVNYVKLTGRSYVRSNEDTVCSRTLCTVARNGTHLEVLFTYTLGKEGRGSTTVTVSSPLTTESKHYLTLFVRRKTYGIVSTTTVIHTNNESTIGLNTYHRTSCIIIATSYLLVNELTILNNHSEGYTYRMEKSSAFKISIKFVLNKRFYVTGNVTFSILENVEDRRGSIESTAVTTYVFSEVTNAFSVIYKYSGRIAVVIKVGIHTADDVVSEVILVILSHLGKLLMSPICFIVGILCELIDLLVSGNDGYIRVRRVNFNYMKHLSSCTGIIIEYDLGLNCSTGYEYVIFLGDYVVVAIGTEFVTIVNYVVVSPIGNCRNRSNGASGDHHYNCNNQSYYTIFRVNHVFLSFHEFLFRNG